MDPRFPYAKKDVILEALGIRRVLGERVILNELSVRIHDVVRPDTTQGQIVAILGPSGVGKTTLFRVLAGIDEPEAGTVRVGHPLAQVTPGLIGVVGQHYPLLHHRRALGNLLIAGRANPNLDKTQTLELAQTYLDRFGIGHEAERFPGQLSGGQRQRLAIAQQLMTGNKIILMDEPFSGLDPIAKDAVSKLIQETANVEEHGTILVITHDIHAAIAISDTIWLMGMPSPEDGVVTEGARIVEEINLMDSIAWRPDNHRMSEFRDVFEHIVSRFPALAGVAA